MYFSFSTVHKYHPLLTELLLTTIEILVDAVWFFFSDSKFKLQLGLHGHIVPHLKVSDHIVLKRASRLTV